MKSLTELANMVLHDMGDRCQVSATQDCKTVVSRVKSEGMSFLTITLSNFGKDFEKSLDQGFVSSDLFAGFQRSGGLPLFLGGFLRLVFTKNGDALLDVPSIDAIRGLRQFLLMNSKIKLQCSPDREKAARQKYIECEQDVKTYDERMTDEDYKSFRRIASLLWSPTLSYLNDMIEEWTILPKHGPGSTADRLFGNEKWENSVWTSRLQTVFPWERFAMNSWANALEVQPFDILEPGEELPVKITLVPKTLKTPRVIAQEPSYMMFMQQALHALFQESYQRFDNPRCFIDYSSQEPNQELARIGSLTGKLATLDLSEASDRVSNQHVLNLFRGYPSLAEGVDATRSRKADVDGEIINLSKFASMGSALCFPIEAMVFATVVFVGIERVLNRPLSPQDVYRLRGSVRVYGDDIIVPVEYTSSVVESLEFFGLKVNQNKSFWTGKFRESCGKDYYDGHDVSVTRVRRELPTQQTHTSEIVSTVELRNHLYWKGYYKVTEELDQLIERFIPFPVGQATSPGLCRASVLPFEAGRIHRDLQTPLVRAAVAKPRPRASQLDGYGALTKTLLMLNSRKGASPLDYLLGSSGSDHLLYAGRPVSVDIKTRWVQPY